MSVIDDLFASLTDAQRTELEHIRKLVHATAPDVTEVMTYGMPGFKYKNKYLLAFAAFKDHLSVFPGGTVAVFADDLQGFKTSKGTIQFTPEKRIPDALLERIILYRIGEIDSK